MAWWHFYITIDLSKNDSFASINSTRKLSNGNHCIRDLEYSLFHFGKISLILTLDSKNLLMTVRMRF